jgi:hypothetical protein
VCTDVLRCSCPTPTRTTHSTVSSGPLPALQASDAWPSPSVSMPGCPKRHHQLMGAVIAVGKAREWVPELIERARVLKVGSGFSAGTDV